MPTFFEDKDGNEVMYFGSLRSGVNHHYQSVMRQDDNFGPATPLAALNGPSGDLGITVRRDGLEVFFLSNRPGGSGTTTLDFWTSTRDSLEAPWSPPVFVPSLGNPALAQGRIAISFDGRELYFASSRTGNFDLGSRGGTGCEARINDRRRLSPGGRRQDKGHHPVALRM